MSSAGKHSAKSICIGSETPPLGTYTTLGTMLPKLSLHLTSETKTCSSGGMSNKSLLLFNSRFSAVVVEEVVVEEDPANCTRSNSIKCSPVRVCILAPTLKLLVCSHPGCAVICEGLNWNSVSEVTTALLLLLLLLLFVVVVILLLAEEEEPEYCN